MKRSRFLKPLLLFFSLLVCTGFFSCASWNAMRAEEYFSIGMAFFEMGDFTEAERWLIRARSAYRTMVASEYNLGRIAFETGRFEEAARYFERIIARDPENVMALRGAAYSRIKNGDIERAEALYTRVLTLVPESVDDGFNHALVLFGMGRYEESEEVLNRYPHSLEENSSAILLFARAQKAQGKVEALDSFEKWTHIEPVKGPEGLHEYAQAMEAAGFYARAIELYMEAIDTHTADTERLKKSTIRFELARLLITADPENTDGITELEIAVAEGFSDRDALDALRGDSRITEEHRGEITRILGRL